MRWQTLKIPGAGLVFCINWALKWKRQHQLMKWVRTQMMHRKYFWLGLVLNSSGSFFFFLFCYTWTSMGWSIRVACRDGKWEFSISVPYLFTNYVILPDRLHRTHLFLIIYLPICYCKIELFTVGHVAHHLLLIGN